MRKLLDSYAKNPNRNLAQKIVKYERKHPFSTVSLTKTEQNVLDRAKQNVKYCSKRAEKMLDFEYDFIQNNI
tara:strand:- start:229 stop:444 length:216 start_codon:yes stop_codon:yes gene_type:complete